MLLMRCLECGTNTKAHRNHDYEYTESGLTNVILSGITVYTCEKCHATYPELPAVQSLHAAIAKDFLFRREALRGEEVRFLRRSEEHTSELESPLDLVCRLLLENKK